MKTIGNDFFRENLNENRKWYIFLGIILIIFGIVLLGSLPFSTMSAVFMFGILMMLGGVLQLVGAFKLFDGWFKWLWALFSIFYFIAGYYAFTTPVQTAYILTNLLGIFLIIAGIIKAINAIIYRKVDGWVWVLISGILTFIAGAIILRTPDAPFWVLGLFLGIDILFQGINYLTLASYIKHKLPKSS